MKAKLFLKYWLPVVIWLSVIFIGSTDVMSAEQTSRFIAPFLRWLKPDIAPETIAQIHLAIRKLGHLTEYAILAMLFLRALRRGARNLARSHIVISWILSSFFAATDEFHQSYIATRTASAADVLIDMIGAAVGLLIFVTLSRGWAKRAGAELTTR